jgi:type II secretory pathway pseudopilin PulG
MAVRIGRCQRGATLVEILVAISIMGTAIVALLAGSSAIYTTSAVNRQATTAAVVARDYVEALEAAVTTDTWCSTSYSPSYSPPSGYSVAVNLGSCPSAAASTPQFQTATITVTAPNGGTEVIRTVVRKP